MRLLATYLFGLFVLELKKTEQDRGGRSAGLRRWLDECAQPLDVGDDGLARSFRNMALLLEAEMARQGLPEQRLMPRPFISFSRTASCRR